MVKVQETFVHPHVSVTVDAEEETENSYLL
jgi:hypothetical protein